MHQAPDPRNTFADPRARILALLQVVILTLPKVVKNLTFPHYHNTFISAQSYANYTIDTQKKKKKDE